MKNNCASYEMKIKNGIVVKSAPYELELLRQKYNYLHRLQLADNPKYQQAALAEMERLSKLIAEMKSSNMLFSPYPEAQIVSDLNAYISAMVFYFTRINLSNLDVECAECLKKLNEAVVDNKRLHEIGINFSFEIEKCNTLAHVLVCGEIADIEPTWCTFITDQTQKNIKLFEEIKKQLLVFIPLTSINGNS